MQLLNYALVFSLFFVSTFSSIQPLFSQGKVVEGISLDRLKHYEDFITEQIETEAISGAATLVMRNGQLVYENAFGYSSLADKKPMKVDDVFYIQSMTKPIISVALMMLYEEGHFQLSDPISKYIPGFENLMVLKDVEAGKDGETEPMKQAITIAHLFTHTSGLTHGLGSSKFDQDFARTLFRPFPSIEDRVQEMLKLPLMGQPGEQWYYSMAPDALSVLIHQFSGMPTNEFLQKRIFDPLGMKDTGYNVPKSDLPRVVQLHNNDREGKLVNSEQQSIAEGNTVWSGVNALFSTPADYAKFCQMLLNKGSYNGKQLLSRKTVELMTMNHTGDLFNNPGHGFGLGFAMVTDLANTGGLGSEGLFFWSGAFNTHFFIDPKEQIIAIFMTQKAPYTNFYHEKLKQFIFQAVVD